MAKRKAGEMDDRWAQQGVSPRTLERRILSAVPSQDVDSLNADAFQIVSPVRGKWLGADEVGRRFWRDPVACLRNLKARAVIRDRTEGERPWLPRLNVAGRAGKKSGLSPERIKSGITELVKQWHLPWWQALKNAVESKGVPPAIAERITDRLAGFLLAQNVVRPEKNFFLDPGAQNLRCGILRQSGRGGEIAILMVGIYAREGPKAPHFFLEEFYLC